MQAPQLLVRLQPRPPPAVPPPLPVIEPVQRLQGVETIPSVCSLSQVRSRDALGGGGGGGGGDDDDDDEGR